MKSSNQAIAQATFNTIVSISDNKTDGIHIEFDMESASVSKPYQWMEDVGISAADVKWLTEIASSEHTKNPTVAKRVQEIQEAASQGLLATIATPVRFN